ncbi:MAG TPA: hypothetical protein VKU85_04380, partial [bacterium]|nr:hypothetical protein [bacterium]
GLHAVHRGAVPAPRAAEAEPGGEGLLLWWNDRFGAVRREPGPEAFPECGTAPLAEEIRARAPAAAGPNPFGRIHFAAGRCAVELIFPESEGPASVVDWTDTQIAQVQASLVRALNWWVSRSNGWLTFVLTNHGRVTTLQEAAQVHYTQLDFLYGELMASLGFPGADYAIQLYEFQEASLARTGADWSFTQFVLYANGFQGWPGVAGYASIGGPFTTTHTGVSFLPFTMAHEIGHIFQAQDEYSPFCSCNGCCFGYLSAEQGNCEECAISGPCIMKGSSGTYTLADLLDMENRVHPCEWTRKMTGLWDGNSDGRWDVVETYPETELVTAMPETLQTSQAFPLEGNAWDVPYPAPASFGQPVTVNRIRTVQSRVDGGSWVEGTALDGIFGSKQEGFRVLLPAVGGGPHTVSVQAVNTAGLSDPVPVQVPFFVYDVLLREGPLTSPERGDVYVIWRVDGQDFGSTYRVFRRRGSAGGEEMIATVASQGGTDDRFSFRDSDVLAGEEYVYRVEVDIPGKGIKNLGVARAEALLTEPRPGTFVSVGPNPAPGAVLLTVAVPRGPRPGVDDILLPGGAGGLRDDPTTGGGTSGPGTLYWRDATVRVLDVRGRVVRDLGRFRHQETTRFNVAWDGRSADGTAVPSGVYLVHVALGYADAVEKVTIVRP